MKADNARAVRLMLDFAEAGQSDELIAQNIASVIAVDSNAEDAADFLGAIISRVGHLCRYTGEIWDGLMPGPPREIDSWEYEVNLFLGDRCVQTYAVHLESDLNIAAHLYSSLGGDEWDRVFLKHHQDGQKYLYTKNDVMDIVAMERLQERGSMFGSIDFDALFQSYHEQAITAAETAWPY